jgi:cysteine desulfurase / selenocysteine lyase
MKERQELRARFAELRRTEFAALAASHYLNAASIGPLTEAARLAMNDYNSRRARVHEMRDADFTDPPRLVRERAARLIGADPEEIALCGNTSFGINLAATALPVSRPTTVLVSDREFPANVYPWMSRDRFSLEVLPTDEDGHPDEEGLVRRIQRGGVGIVSVSSVQFTDGFVADLERIGRTCREHGAFFVVDAIQSLGQLPMNVRDVPVDVLASGAHKWLCGPLGAGFVYVRRELHSRMEPAIVGWSSMRATQDLGSVLDFEWDLLPDARRFEVATAPLQDHLGFAESLRVLLDAEIASIAAYLDDLLEPARQWLQSRAEVTVLSSFEPCRRSGILSFRTPATPATYRSLMDAGVICSLREGAIRLSAHCYNSAADIGRLLDILDARARGGWA